jgi:hypothetical protein
VPSDAPIDVPSDIPSSAASRDLVWGSQLNGPHWGSRHSWAWPQVSDNGCSRYSYLQPGVTASPCYVKNQFVNRVLNFDSSYMNFKFEFDRGMKATIAMSDTAGGGGGTESISFYPSGWNVTACFPPPDGNWDDYPIRLVRSGRYLHHWYAIKMKCNGVTDDTRMELKVTPDW